MKVRIAMRGWNGGEPAETVDDVRAGVRMPWVELDGVRFSDVVSARFEAGKDEASSCRLVLDVIGAVELVYVGKDDEPLPGGPVRVDFPENFGTIDHQTYVLREDVEAAP